MLKSGYGWNLPAGVRRASVPSDRPLIDDRTQGRNNGRVVYGEGTGHIESPLGRLERLCITKKMARIIINQRECVNIDRTLAIIGRLPAAQ
jgi:hypothetical protein